MKILRIYFRLPPLNGGMENHIKYLSLEQSKSYDITIAFSNGAEIQNVKSLRVLSRLNLFTKKINPLTASLFYIVLIARIIADNKSFSALHLHGDWSSFIFAPILKRLTKAEKVFFSFHGSLNDSFTHNIILPFTIKKFCDRIFVTGYDSYKQLESTSKAVFQPSGIKKVFLYQKVKVPNKRFRFVTVTFLRPQKNVMTFLNIARILSIYDFIIIGDGPQMDHLVEYAQKYGIGNVQFLGKKSSDEIKILLDSSDFFLFTSLEEGTPTAVMEAMACGLPIITSNAGGVESIVKDYINGFVIRTDFTKTEQYCEFIDLLLRNQNLITEIGKNNVTDAKLFSWDNVGTKISIIMDQA